MLAPPFARGSEPQAQPRVLPRRVRDVLEGAALGETTAETAAFLYLGSETVKTHRAVAFRLLQARNVTHAVAIALELGLLDLEQARGRRASGRPRASVSY